MCRNAGSTVLSCLGRDALFREHLENNVKLDVAVRASINCAVQVIPVHFIVKQGPQASGGLVGSAPHDEAFFDKGALTRNGSALQLPRVRPGRCLTVQLSCCLL